jgi:hypothetical protein
MLAGQPRRTLSRNSFPCISLPPLASLFSRRSLYFQSLTASFAKKRGAGMPAQTRPLESPASSLFVVEGFAGLGGSYASGHPLASVRHCRGASSSRPGLAARDMIRDCEAVRKVSERERDGRRNRVTADPCAQGGPELWLPSDALSKVGRGARTVGGRTPVRRANRGFHPCENRQSFSGRPPMGLSRASWFYSTPVSPNIRKVSVKPWRNNLTVGG